MAVPRLRPRGCIAIFIMQHLLEYSFLIMIFLYDDVTLPIFKILVLKVGNPTFVRAELDFPLWYIVGSTAKVPKVHDLAVFIMKTAAQAALVVWVALSLISRGAAQEASADFYVFNDASATSTYGSGFEPSRALQPGPGYWSSAGDHPTDEQVSWSGTLEVPGKVKGLKIRWEYAPQEVQVSTSADGQNFFVAVPWQPTAGTGPSFDEIISFSSPQECKVIVLTMRKATNQFFGINEITPLGAGQPLFMIVAGITSPSGEMCLQVEGGKMNKEGARVTLRSCEDAIAMGDGRELWFTNPQTQLVSALSHPPLCVVLEGGEEADGGVLILSKCSRALEEGDGRSGWTFQANSQIRLAKPGSWCMTQKNVNGSTSGLVDLVSNSGVTAESSSNADDLHGPQKAIDRDTNTSWASDSFEGTDEHPVTLDINIGKVVRLSSARIDWEQPALAYTLQASSDGTTFMDVASNPANPSASTRDSLGGVDAQYIRILMQKPHPRLGKREEKYRYAIKELGIFASKLEPGIGNCRDAANSDDARDKYFVSYVSTFDSEFAKKIPALGKDVIAKRRSLEVLSGKIEELFPDMETCRDEKGQQSQHLASLSTTVGQLLSSYEKATEGARIVGVDTVIPGDTEEHPARDCYAIKLQVADAVSGFYWVRPRCAHKALRAYCDMETGTMIYVQTKNEFPRIAGRPEGLLASAYEVRQACASIGLEPLVPRALSHIHSATKAAKQMHLQLDGEEGIPIAHDPGCAAGQCSGSFRDFYDGATDLMGLILALASADSSATAWTDTAGLGRSNGDKMGYFALSTTPLAALLCSTNATGEVEQAPALTLKCDEVMEGHEAFKATLNTNILVECPPGCENIEALPVFGSGGVYAERSSICKAGVHAGLIRDGGVFTVAIESPNSSFEGSKQNGIESKSLHLDPGEAIRSMRLFKIRQECPGDTLGPSSSSAQSPQTSFLELSSNSMPASNASPPPYDPALAAASDAAKDLATHGIDPIAVNDAKIDAGTTVGEARKLIKPAEQLGESVFASALSLFRDTEILTNRLLATSAGVATRLEYLQDELKHLEDTHIVQGGYKSYQLNPQDTTFEKEFRVEDSSFTHGGPSHWGFAALVSGHQNVFGQSTAIRGTAEVHGTYALLRRHSFYDFILHVEFLPMGSGCVGIGFRMKDHDNGYLLLLHQKKGRKTLERLEKGVRKTIAERKDGGFIQGIWHKVRIQGMGGHITVCIGEEDEPDAEIFTVLDERFASGAIGFFTSGMQDGAYFDKLRVEALPCETPQTLLPPLPPQCSVFTDTYFSSVGVLYKILDGEDKGGAVGHWEYRDRIGGRNQVLAQLNAVSGASEVGTMAILKGQRMCKNGFISFDFFSQCTRGAIGAVFRFVSEETYMILEATATELRLRSVVNKKSSVIGRKAIELGINVWHTLHVAFEGSRVAVRLQNADSVATKLVVEIPSEKEAPTDGAVGLSAFNCGGVAFDTIQLSPMRLETRAEPRFVEAVVSDKIWSACTSTEHFIARREHCMEMLPNKSKARQLSCAADYCSECCAFHTSLLSPQHKIRCERGCTQKTRAAQDAEAAFNTKVQRCATARDKRAALCSQWLYEQKHNKKALKQADLILKKFPEHGETLSMKGLILSNMGNDKKQDAYDYAKRGLRADITNCVCWHVLGLLYRQDKDYAEASKCFVQTLRLDPNNYQAMRDLAHLQIHERNLQGFLETRRHILKARSRFIREWAAFAVANHLVGRLTIAQDILGEMENQFGESRDLDPFEKSEIMLYKATLLEEMGEYRKCYDFLAQREADILDETSLLEMQGRMSIFLRDYEKGRAAYKRLIESNKDNERYILGFMACDEDARIRELFALPSCSLNGAIGKADSMDFRKNLKQLQGGKIFQSTANAYVCLMPGSLRSSGEDGSGWLESCFTSQADRESRLQDPELHPVSGWKPWQTPKAPPSFRLVRIPPDEIQDAISKYFSGAPRCFFPAFRPFLHLYFPCLALITPSMTGAVLCVCMWAIDHTPTFADLYLVKGRIFKHAGAYHEACELHEKARNLDLADRLSHEVYAYFAHSPTFTPSDRRGACGLVQLYEL
ncbi:uncharacterized protein LOC34617699 [Cyclospora cayetanensis]|uniref:Uncharacterized protein LOC34617699 n=1 Tax=Cyclospora cayetanensis TaxID=88456 RepID=A0A6P6S1F2_9EIME|nr:uncharacterized protein LOC34617699 [Cyclospora cayetanensis]